MKIQKNILINTISMILPIVIMVLVGIVSILLLGEGGSIWRYNERFVELLMYYKHSILTSDNLIYTQNVTGGNEIFSSAAVYLNSPLNLIAVLFPDKYINIGINIIALIKIGISGLMFSVMLNRTNRARYINIIFGTTYALSSYYMVNMGNIMNYDSIMLIPMIVLGIYDIVRRNKYKIYILFLGMAIITNINMAIYVIILSILMYIYISVKEGREIKEKIKIYVLSSIGGIMLSSYLIIPIIRNGWYRYVIQGNGTGISISDVLTGIVNGSSSSEGYISIGVIVFFAICYFLNKEIKIRERVTSIILLSIMMMLMSINSGIGYIIEFYLVYICYETVNRIESIEKRHIIYSIYAILILYVMSYYRSEINVYSVVNMIILGILIFGYMYIREEREERVKILIVPMIVVLQIMSIFVNVLKIEINENIEEKGNRIGIEKESGIREAIEYIKGEEKDRYGYKVEFLVEGGEGKELGLRYGVGSVSGGLNTNKRKSEIYESLGVSVDTVGNRFYLNSEGPIFTPAILGVKYLVTDRGEIGFPYKKKKEIGSGSERIYVYENPIVIPNMITIRDNYVLTIDLTDNDKYDYYNNILRLLSDSDDDDVYSFKFFDPLPFSYDNWLIYQDGILQKNKNAYIDIVSSNLLNGYFKYISFRDLETNKRFQYIMPQYENSIFKIYSSKVNSKYRMFLKMHEKAFLEDISYTIVTEDISKFFPYISTLNKEILPVEKKSSSKYFLKANLDTDFLYVTTIPFDKNWKAKIDGKFVQTESIFNSFVTVPIPEGKHYVELKYIPSGLYIGVLLSLLFFVLFFGKDIYIIFISKIKKYILLMTFLLYDSLNNILNLLSKLYKKETVINTISMILPIVIMMLVGIVSILLLGEGGSIWRYNERFVELLMYYKHSILTSDNLIYTQNVTGGNEIFSSAAVYLNSPLNLIAVLFPDKYINIGINIIALIKIGISGLMFSVMLNRTNRARYINIIFGTTYALSSYYMVNMGNIMNYDSIMLIPMIVLGIYDIVRRNKYKIYILFLGMAIITNINMAIYVIILSILMYIYISVKEGREIKEKIKIYVLSSIGGIMLSSYLIIPIIRNGWYRYVIQGNGTGISISDVLTGIVNGSSSSEGYISIGVIVFFAICYFLNKEIKIRERVTSIILLSIMMMLMSINSGIGYIIEFYLVYICYETVNRIESIEKRHIIYSIYAILILYVMSYYRSEINVYSVVNMIILGILIFGYMYIREEREERVKILIVPMIVVLQIMSIFVNVLKIEINENIEEKGNRIGIEKESGIREAIEYIKGEEKDRYGYKVEFLVEGGEGKELGLRYGVGSVSGGLNTNKRKSEIYESLGVSVDTVGNRFYLNSEGPIFTPAILGVKYLVTDRGEIGFPYKKKKEIGSGSERIYVYENPIVIPNMITIRDNYVLTIDLTDNDKYDYYNNILRLLSDSELEPVYLFDDASLIESKTDENIIYYNGQMFLGKNSYFDITTDKPLNKYYKNISFKYTDGYEKNIQPLLSALSQTFKLNLNNKNNKYHIDIEMQQNIEIDDAIYLYLSEDINQFKIYLDNIIKSDNYVSKVKKSSSSLEFNYNNQVDSLLVTTIPFDKSWKAQIDGKHVKIKKLFNSFITIDVPDGNHKIELKYIPRGLYFGIFLSILSFLLLFAKSIFELKHVKKSNYILYTVGNYIIYKLLKIKSRKLLIYLLSFIIPIIIVSIAFISSDIFPFGPNQAIYWDTEIEDVHFLSYFKHLIYSNDNFLYSLSNTGGNEMISFCGYYLLSPLNFIMLLCPNEYMNVALQVIMLLKIAFCGLFFSVFLNNVFKVRYINILFAVTYALSSYNLMNISNLMFFDGIALFPITILGIYKIVKEDKYLIYILSMVLTIIFNSFIGYIVLLFSFLFFVYVLLVQKFTKSISKKEIIKKIKIYVLSTVLTLGLTAFLLLPISASLDDTKYDFFKLTGHLFDLKVNIHEIFIKFFTGAFETNKFYDASSPHLFIGIFGLILLILYFVNKGILKKEKIISGIFLSFLLISFIFNIFFTIWNMGVENPSGTIYRFGFVFEFFIIYLAYK